LAASRLQPLILTIFIQQRQIAHQEAYSRQQDRENAALRYEETLFRLLELYKACLMAVVAKKGEGQAHGIDALRLSTEKAVKQIRTEKFLPQFSVDCEKIN
jgi:hypothetical protein